MKLFNGLTRYLNQSQTFRLVGKALNNFLTRYELELTNKSFRLKSFLNQYQVDFIVDIGANKGQFATRVFDSQFKGNLVSIEPQQELYEVLVRKSQKHKRWRVFPPIALSDYEGYADLNLSENSQSSSLLVITSKHTTAAPTAAFKGTNRVRVSTLDNLLLPEIDSYSNIFLKIDVQGGERSVLQGGKRFLTKTLLIQIELSLSEMYEGEPLFNAQYEYLYNLGFRLIDFNPVFRDPVSNELLQFDGIFLNTKMNSL